ncbi:MAG: hypothetical protein ACK4SF_10175 [Algoriphagus aquaeductus]|uniref:Uncharacterized protein n=1 Tax=Algoriphagus aquaeductus TaxID=475299 RepID=A0A326RNX8_9BACT|nr:MULTISPECIES: hypothetical protein [Algoriphagus]PZV81604.1 hypothetical protein CLV31_110137 [Algoriphagus aquaeductus]
MEKLPKLQEFTPPEGYFETLPDEILKKTAQKPSFPYLKYAAAALLFVTLGWWQLGNLDQSTQQLSLEEEALLYIESNQWTAEDVLSLSENPNEILDMIIMEEFGQQDPLWAEEDNWF